MGITSGGMMPVFLENVVHISAAAANKTVAAAAGTAAVDTGNAVIAAAVALAVGVLIYIKRHRRFKASDE